MSTPTKQYTIVLGCDSAGTTYKTALKADLEKDPRVSKVIDIGVSEDGNDIDTAYPHIGVAVGRKIMAGEAERGLLLCGTGMGVAIAANKVPGWVFSREKEGEGSGRADHFCLSVIACHLIDYYHSATTSFMGISYSDIVLTGTETATVVSQWILVDYRWFNLTYTNRILSSTTVRKPLIIEPYPDIHHVPDYLTLS